MITRKLFFQTNIIAEVINTFLHPEEISRSKNTEGPHIFIQSVILMENDANGDADDDVCS